MVLMICLQLCFQLQPGDLCLTRVTQVAYKELNHYSQKILDLLLLETAETKRLEKQANVEGLYCKDFA